MKYSLLPTYKEAREIYEQHVERIYRICFAYLKNKSDAEDATQDTFIKLLSYQKKFESLEHEKAWLIVTATNICKNHLKYWWNKKKDDREKKDIVSEESFQIDETFKVVMELPDKYKTIIYLYYYEGYSSVEIAKIMKRPSSTIRNYLHEARELLRIKLGGDFNEES